MGLLSSNASQNEVRLSILLGKFCHFRTSLTPFSHPKKQKLSYIMYLENNRRWHVMCNV